MQDASENARGRGGRPKRAWLWLALAGFLACAAPPGSANPGDALSAEFDARGFTAAEKRLLQLGLTLDGSYSGLIDGRWGAGSQAALEAHGDRTAAIAPDDPDAFAPMRLAGTLAAEAMAFIVDQDLGYRGGPAFGHRLLTPPGAFATEYDAGAAWHVLRAGGLEITLLVGDEALTEAVHGAVAGDLRGDPAPYLVRRDARLVTAGGPDGGRLYARSDVTAPGGLWVTTILVEQAFADPRLIDVVAASITTDAAADIDIADGRLVSLALALGAAAPAEDAGPAVEAALPEPAAAPGPSGGGLSTEMGSGTGFFVNATDLVTAAHVVEGCAEVTLDDGAPLALVAVHPTLDLALLASPRRSPSFLPLAAAAGPRLGAGVFALGYPLYGTLGTGLSMTRGNVSATSGLGDDPSGLTITAPIHPGNSGGPLLSLDGEIVGVVVATIDKMRVAEAFGALPENINFAVAGAELGAFLDAEGVVYPTRGRLPLEPDGGVPDAMQAAVVPVLCWYD